VKSWFQTGKRSTNEFHTDLVYDYNQQYVNERAADFFHWRAILTFWNILRFDPYNIS
jgi:hypothetical protein